ncbi:LLM class flavin-dependent oxidoreductase [[Mycobacterium] vasticus]|uniref:LLM class flavin-dependent oxidoreductase n=1 Tax=[Mycobacterium] vasticus TaxID=2875777 RepID=A0ABU5Z3R2_9MYCO|nr:LLM class flavin-dependent oxidoreductase [Mycolicibacter sp. MYC017]MEB3071716.1 LLM class flavin-dependent oxidoreductase [Mycolicibacter sp. MYC017]
MTPETSASAGPAIGLNVGIYLDLRNPPQWRRDWSRVYAFGLEVCEEAERLGAHSVWLSEHHLFDDGYLPQPLTFAAAVAARTRRIRIGTAVLIAPFRPAIELAEDAAIVDAISGGRLDLGLGAGYRRPEFDSYGVDFTRRYTDTDERVRALRGLWRDSRVLPAPIQDPVPIWLGYNGPRGAHRAGLLGEGLLSISPDLYAPYRQGLIEGGHDPASARMAGVVNAFVTDDPERDWPIVARQHAYQWDSYRHHMVEGTDAPAPRPIDPERSRAAGLTSAMGGLLYGTPDDVAATIAKHTIGIPARTVFLWASLGGMDEATTIRHVQTICQQLAPMLRRANVA